MPKSAGESALAHLSATALDDERAGLQRRTVRVLAGAQLLGAIAFGVTVAIGSLLATAVSGDEAFSGLATSMFTLGAAGGSRSRAATLPRSPVSASS